MATKGGQAEAGVKKSRLSAAVPGVGMLRAYKPAWLRFDLVAGIVLAAILVPQGLAYAELAGLPPVTGLYTTIACLIVYALLGPSRVLVLGPDSAVSPLIFAAIAPLMVADDPATAIASPACSRSWSASSRSASDSASSGSSPTCSPRRSRSAT